jgi:ABC-type lipoprotein export system ATPase subunit
VRQVNTLRVSPFGTDKTPMMAHASSQGEEIMKLFCKLNEQGMTIVQVTHSEKNTTYDNRIIQLRDGWIVKKE